MNEERIIHKICLFMDSPWAFSAGSTAYKYIIFSRNYPQRLNPLTQVHATKTDLYVYVQRRKENEIFKNQVQWFSHLCVL